MEASATKKSNKRVTVYLQSDYHGTLKVKAAVTECSVSDLVNDAARDALREDSLDLAAGEDRRGRQLPAGK